MVGDMEACDIYSDMEAIYMAIWKRYIRRYGSDRNGDMDTVGGMEAIWWAIWKSAYHREL